MCIRDRIIGAVGEAVIVGSYFLRKLYLRYFPEEDVLFGEPPTKQDLKNAQLLQNQSINSDASSPAVPASQTVAGETQPLLVVAEERDSQLLTGSIQNFSTVWPKHDSL